MIRDWSLITGRGGGDTKREGGACQVLPLRKGGGGAEKVLAMLKGGGTNNFEVVLTQELEVSAIVMGACKKFPTFKKGGAKSVTLS